MKITSSKSRSHPAAPKISQNQDHIQPPRRSHRQSTSESIYQIEVLEPTSSISACQHEGYVWASGSTVHE